MHNPRHVVFNERKAKMRRGSTDGFASVPSSLLVNCRYMIVISTISYPEWAFYSWTSLLRRWFVALTRCSSLSGRARFHQEDGREGKGWREEATGTPFQPWRGPLRWLRLNSDALDPPDAAPESHVFPTTTWRLAPLRGMRFCVRAGGACAQQTRGAVRVSGRRARSDGDSQPL